MSQKQCCLPQLPLGTFNVHLPQAPPSALTFFNASHAARCVARHGVPSHPVPAAPVGGVLPAYSSLLLVSKTNRPALPQALDMRRTAMGVSSAWLERPRRLVRRWLPTG